MMLARFVRPYRVSTEDILCLNLETLRRPCCGFHDTWTLSPRSFGHSFQAHLDTCPTSTWTGSRSAATQVCI
ncbi:hypothetical protein CXB34_31825, partial [Pseudomonas amygdali pv. morsprunorum]